MIRIRRAKAEDLPAVLDLLGASGLPTDGIVEHLPRLLVGEEGGAIIATAGLEPGEASALLRSVAVAPDRRSRGVGIEIVRQALRFARLSGVETVYLLTTTAAGFFARLGFKPILRAEIEGAFPDSVETKPGGACASAEPMALRDLSRVQEPYPRR